MSLAKLFTNNYDYLNTVAKRITRSRDQRMAPDLLNSTYLVMHEKGCPEFKTDEDFIKWFCKCMKNYFQWPNSDFNRYYKEDAVSIDCQFRVNNEVLGDDRISEQKASNRIDEAIVDQGALRDIELYVEQANDFTKELIEISSSLGKNKTLKYIELVEFKQGLPPHESILFELYFEKELSTRKIADLYSIEGNVMNYQSVNLMVNAIKSKIKTYKWKQLNS